jgi:outer membrane autotransporter protein
MIFNQFTDTGELMRFDPQTGRVKSSIIGTAGLGLAVFSWACQAANPLTASSTLNQTQANMADAQFGACSDSNTSRVSAAFRARCNALVGASLNGANAPLVGNAERQISPEQVIANGTQSTRVAVGGLNLLQSAVDARANLLLAGLSDSSKQLYLAQSKLLGANGGAAGADSVILGPIGVWFNNAYTVGNVDSSFQQLGYGFGNWAFALGADYRVLDRLAVGAAFSYQNNNADFNRSQGNTESDVYTGMIYAAYHVTDNLHLDGNASYGGSNYDTTRNIRYSLPSNDLSGPDTVNSRAKSNAGGEHYAFGLRAGYNLNIDSVTVEPYARFNYYALQTDPYSEKGGAGWGLKVSEQNVRSLTTSLGMQFSRAFSLPWGILIPQVYGEWHHQYKDNARTISASFLGDFAGQQFRVVTERPTRNYGTVGARVAASFAHNLSGYLGYDALVGYRNVSSHRVMVGGRLEF